ncbi:MAG: transglutaminase-like domain-containing protein [Sphaerochaeta sp.]|uniref:transglutaminase-like domain-containing protein n=1 Tax=Sphaerochaeta sp. TaxID=1972642 RepID=UPI002FCB8C83
MESLDVTPYLQPTTLLDFDATDIQFLVRSRNWRRLQSTSAQVNAIFCYVRDEIAFGYAKQFALHASEILVLGYGNCITKTTLLMALLRAVGIPCRLKAGMVSKVLHRGLLHGLSYRLSFDTLYHSWVEVWYKNNWVEIGGHIIDRPYLEKLQAKFPDYMGSFYGYGIAVLNFRNPPITWEEDDTFIQSKAIAESLGTFNDPDAFFAAFPEAESRTHTLRYRKMLRPKLNASIAKLRTR